MALKTDDITVKLLIEFGDEEAVRDGVMRYFSKASRDRIARGLGQAFLENMGPLSRCFLIEGYDGTIITVGHRLRRIRRRVRSNRDRARSARARRRTDEFHICVMPMGPTCLRASGRGQSRPGRLPREV